MRWAFRWVASIMIRSGFGPFAGQRGEDPVEHAQSAPAHEAVVERLVWTIPFWSVFPLQAVADYIDDPAHNSSIIDPRHAMRKWKMR